MIVGLFVRVVANCQPRMVELVKCSGCSGHCLRTGPRVNVQRSPILVTALGQKHFGVNAALGEGVSEEWRSSCRVHRLSVASFKSLAAVL